MKAHLQKQKTRNDTSCFPFLFLDFPLKPLQKTRPAVSNPKGKAPQKYMGITHSWSSSHRLLLSSRVPRCHTSTAKQRRVGRLHLTLPSFKISVNGRVSWSGFLMKHQDQKQAGEGRVIWLIFLCCRQSLKEVTIGTQTGQEPEAGAFAEAMKGCYSLACSSWLTQSGFLTVSWAFLRQPLVKKMPV